MGIIRENYHLVYQSRRKVEIYRNTGVSKTPKTMIWMFRPFFFLTSTLETSYTHRKRPLDTPKRKREREGKIREG